MSDCRLFVMVGEEKTEIKSCKEDLPLQEKVLTLLEDYEVAFEVVLENDFQNPSLWLQDLELGYYTSKDNFTNGCTKYNWKPDKFFRNHFGYCQLSLSGIRKVEDIVEEKRVFFPYIEILATKVNAQNTTRMLNYLELKLKDVVRTCFSETFWAQGSSKIGIAHSNDIISQAQDCISVLENILPQIKRRPVSKLSPRIRTEYSKETQNVSEQTLNWLCSSPDVLYTTKKDNYLSFKVRNRYFAPERLVIEELEENKDIYENRVIMGLVNNMKARLQEVKGFYLLQEIRFKEESDDSETFGIPLNYQRFTTVASRFGIPFCQKQVASCEILLKRVDKLLRELMNFLDVTESETIPRLTPKFRNHPHYRQVFETCIRWYRLGRLSYSGDIFLFGIKSLDLLYEFYCLFRLIESLEEIGYTLNNSIKEAQDLFGRPNRMYYFSNIYMESIQLWYEPEIGMFKSDVKELIRLDERAPLRPDFVLMIKSNSRSRYAIFDAKYSTVQTTKEYYMPDLVYKYLHKIGSPYGGFSPVWFLWAITPSNSHVNPYYMFKKRLGKLPLPCVGILPLNPGEEDKSRNLLVEILIETQKIMGSLDNSKNEL